MAVAGNELDAACFRAVQALPGTSKAQLLLNSALAMIDAGQYGDEVESYFEILLRMSDLPKEHMTKALIARGTARRQAGERLVAQAEEGAFTSELELQPTDEPLDFRTVLRADPHNSQARALLRHDQVVRAPPEALLGSSLTT